MATTSDLHVVETRPLVAPAVLHQELPIDVAALETVASARQLPLGTRTVHDPHLRLGQNMSHR